MYEYLYSCLFSYNDAVYYIANDRGFVVSNHTHYIFDIEKDNLFRYSSYCNHAEYNKSNITQSRR